ILLTNNVVDANTVGIYTNTYVATDTAGNATTNARLVYVQDTTKPVITVAGVSPVTVECHGSYTDAGATANDSCAGTVSVSTSGSVNVNVAGSYTLTYTATDPSGNTQTATRIVNVVDTTPPTIALLGGSPLTNECHTAFVDPGFTALDDCSASLI